MTSTLPDVEGAARRARAERRSEQLLGAAARLMARDGSEAVSMQAVAAEAGVSVGLIYRYFGGKQDLLLAVIVDVLDAFAVDVPLAIEAAGDDPVERLVAAFGRYCRIIDERRHAAVLTYREGKSLSADGREQIKRLEISTSVPLRDCLRAGVADGTFRSIDVDLVAFDLLLLAQAWALKHWALAHTLEVDQYVRQQLALVLRAVLEPGSQARYARHLDDR